MIILKIILESENSEEENKKITFICGLFVLFNSINAQIKCLLKETNFHNLI